jgi:hypothetical protein
MKRAVVVAALGAVAALLVGVARAAAETTLPLVPTTPGPEAVTRYPRLQPIPWFYRQIDLQRQNIGLNGRKNAIRSEQTYAGPKDAYIWENKPLSDW